LLMSSMLRDKSIYVFWGVDSDKVTTETMNTIYTTGVMLNVTKAILILNDETSVAKRLENSDTFTIEKFGLEDLQVNITKHQFVPKHSVLE